MKRVLNAVMLELNCILIEKCKPNGTIIRGQLYNVYEIEPRGKHSSISIE